MAIYCRICETEIEVLNGVRCRKCRQLVCKDCVEGKWDEGVICKDCVAHDVEREAASAAAYEKEEARSAISSGAPNILAGGGGEAPSPRGRLMVPVWAWAVVGLALGILFLVIVYAPRLKLDRLERDLHSRDLAVSEKAGRALSEMGGRRAYSILLAALESPRESTKLMAIHALGYWEGEEATEILQSLSLNLNKSDDVRTAAALALERQRQLSSAEK